MLSSLLKLRSLFPLGALLFCACGGPQEVDLTLSFSNVAASAQHPIHLVVSATQSNKTRSVAFYRDSMGRFLATNDLSQLGMQMMVQIMMPLHLTIFLNGASGDPIDFDVKVCDKLNMQDPTDTVTAEGKLMGVRPAAGVDNTVDLMNPTLSSMACQ